MKFPALAQVGADNRKRNPMTKSEFDLLSDRRDRLVRLTSRCYGTGAGNIAWRVFVTEKAQIERQMRASVWWSRILC